MDTSSSIQTAGLKMLPTIPFWIYFILTLIGVGFLICICTMINVNKGRQVCYRMIAINVLISSVVAYAFWYLGFKKNSNWAWILLIGLIVFSSLFPTTNKKKVKPEAFEVHLDPEIYENEDTTYDEYAQNDIKQDYDESEEEYGDEYDEEEEEEYDGEGDEEEYEGEGEEYEGEYEEFDFFPDSLDEEEVIEPLSVSNSEYEYEIY